MIGHRITEFHNWPFNPVGVYVLGDCYIFVSYPKEWLDSENEDWYTPTPEIFHVVTKDGTVLSEIYF